MQTKLTFSVAIPVEGMSVQLELTIVPAVTGRRGDHLAQRRALALQAALSTAAYDACCAEAMKPFPEPLA